MNKGTKEQRNKETKKFIQLGPAQVGYLLKCRGAKKGECHDHVTSSHATKLTSFVLFRGCCVKKVLLLYILLS